MNQKEVTVILRAIEAGDPWQYEYGGEWFSPVVQEPDTYLRDGFMIRLRPEVRVPTGVEEGFLVCKSTKKQL